MQLLPTDILLRETSQGVTVWVSQRLVMECCRVTGSYLKQACRTRFKSTLPASWQQSGSEFFYGDYQGKSWRWGKKGGEFYYDYDRIPDRAPRMFRSKLPTKADLISHVEENNTKDSRARNAEIENAIRDEVKELYTNTDTQWINLHSGFPIKIDKCRDYALALGWCRFIYKVSQAGNYEAYGFKTKRLFYDFVAGILSRADIAGLKIGTGESLRQKMLTFPASDPEEQRSWIISGKHGNNNRLIVGKYPILDMETGEYLEFDIHQALMFRAYMNVGETQKEFFETLWSEQYIPGMQAFGMRPVALRTFRLKLSALSTRLKADYFRHGADYYKKHLLTYVPGEKLSYAHSLFCGDGSATIGYKFWKEVVDEKGNKRYKLTIMNLYLVTISDVASGHITGWGVAPEGSHKETFSMVQDAVRMAVRNGGNQTMFEMVSDNATAFSKGESKQYLAYAFNKVRNIEPGNSQANPAETQFRLFKNTTLRSQRNFIRTSHNASIGNRANVDNISKEDYPTYESAVQQLEELINKWNNTPRGNGLTPAQMFENKHPECKPLDALTLRLINGERTTRKIASMRGFVTPVGKGNKIMYEIPDYWNSGIKAIEKAAGSSANVSVSVVYDATGADLYSADGKFILTCTVVQKAKNAQVEKTEKHKTAESHHMERKNAMLKAALEFDPAVEYALSAASMQLGYEAEVRLGGNKTTVNAAYEAEVDAIIPETPAKKSRKKTGKVEKKEVVPPPPADMKSQVLEQLIFGNQ